MTQSDLIAKIKALVNTPDKIDWDKQGFAGIGLTSPRNGFFQIKRKAPDGIKEIRDCKNIPDIFRVVSKKASEDVYCAIFHAYEKRRNKTWTGQNFKTVESINVSTDVNRKPIVQQFYDALFCVLSINDSDADKIKLTGFLLDKLNEEIDSLDQEKVENYKKFTSAIKANNSAALKYVNYNISNLVNNTNLDDNQKLSFDGVFNKVCKNEFQTKYIPSDSINSVNC